MTARARYLLGLAVLLLPTPFHLHAGKDINPLAVMMCKINGSRYAPWLSSPSLKSILGTSHTKKDSNSLAQLLPFLHPVPGLSVPFLNPDNGGWTMIVNPKDGACRSCKGTLKIVGADDVTMSVECQECGESYEVETDAFNDGGIHYWPGFFLERAQVPPLD